MKKLALFAGFALVLAACGGSKIGSKTDAVKAVTGMQNLGGSQTSKKSLTAGIGEPNTLNTTVQGKKGTMSVTGSFTMDIDMVNNTVTIAYDMNLSCTDFSMDDINTYNGTESYKMNVSASSSGDTGSATATIKLVADMKVSGEYESAVKADLTMTMAMSAASSSSGTVEMTLNGTITADGTTYTFNNEKYKVTNEEGGKVEEVPNA